MRSLRSPAATVSARPALPSVEPSSATMHSHLAQLCRRMLLRQGARVSAASRIGIRIETVGWALKKRES